MPAPTPPPGFLGAICSPWKVDKGIAWVQILRILLLALALHPLVPLPKTSPPNPSKPRSVSGRKLGTDNQELRTLDEADSPKSGVGPAREGYRMFAVLTTKGVTSFGVPGSLGMDGEHTLHRCPPPSLLFPPFCLPPPPRRSPARELKKFVVGRFPHNVPAPGSRPE